MNVVYYRSITIPPLHLMVVYSGSITIPSLHLMVVYSGSIKIPPLQLMVVYSGSITIPPRYPPPRLMKCLQRNSNIVLGYIYIIFRFT